MSPWLVVHTHSRDVPMVGWSRNVHSMSSLFWFILNLGLETNLRPTARFSEFSGHWLCCLVAHDPLVFFPSHFEKKPTNSFQSPSRIWRDGHHTPYAEGNAPHYHAFQPKSFDHGKLPGGGGLHPTNISRPSSSNASVSHILVKSYSA